MELQKGSYGYTKEKTFNNYRSILNAVNKHFGWESNIIYYDRMDNKAQEIADFIYERYKISNTAQYKQKLSSLSSLMTRTQFGKDHKIKMMVVNANVMLSVADQKIVNHIDDWELLQPKLEQLGKEESIRGILARIFSYGYVLRVGEIFKTRIDINNDVDNYLDLNNCKWYIREQKNGTEKTFSVPAELCDSIKKRPRKADAVWLLSKVNGKKYSTGAQRLTYRNHNWPLPNNNALRKSYETWNRNRSGRSDEEIEHWHYILGHNRQTIDVHYDLKVLEPVEEPVVEPAVESPKVLPERIKPVIKKKETIKVTPERIPKAWWDEFNKPVIKEKKTIKVTPKKKKAETLFCEGEHRLYMTHPYPDITVEQCADCIYSKSKKGAN